MKKRTYKFFAAALFTSLFLMVVGCTENTETKTKDENIQTIKAVLHNMFTGPEDELKQIWKTNEAEEELKALSKYSEEQFKDYFTEDMYMEYSLASNEIVFLKTAYRNNYNLKVIKIKFEKTNSDEDIYNFSMEVQLQKVGKELSEIQIVNGQANLSKEHKIEEILIRNEGVLKSLKN
ncbi:hypothetical protein [Virgibacillus salinus]|uniref:Lipoprotein n=1 Tax=Virgibacillus salinus TaxID=553311 RepID=A0A1H0XWU4_9BACI|nr:hypothetical protein [Virgibacillus salinus]SDQ07362.1 hypothetical protein SAMN05216231_0267 [Virgibacillus salinus]